MNGIPAKQAEQFAEHIDENGFASLWHHPAFKHISVREGVELRHMSEADAPSILRILDSDPSIRKTVTFAAPIFTVADAMVSLQKSKTYAQVMRFVIECGGEVAGVVSFRRDTAYFGQPIIDGAYAVGYFLDQSMRGKGLVTDSLQALMNLARQELGATSFFAFCEASNTASTAVLSRLKFKATGESYTEPKYGWIERKYELKVSNVH